jgi:hypothetical protein
MRSEDSRSNLKPDRTSTQPARKPVRTVLGGRLSILKVRIFDSFGEGTFEVTIEPVPRRDPSIAPPFTTKQGQYLAFIYHYSKIHGKTPPEPDFPGSRFTR